ncbi:uncharacterized protein DMAD_06437 [Drosophila madeirensis]|uniref:Uncharacterized protein n=1 Tax=Drosophila madeirensis TaxID=30013 RepID=A0AAU9FQG2_DROMD
MARKKQKSRQKRSTLRSPLTAHKKQQFLKPLLVSESESGCRNLGAILVSPKQPAAACLIIPPQLCRRTASQPQYVRQMEPSAMA